MRYGETRTAPLERNPKIRRLRAYIRWLAFLPLLSSRERGTEREREREKERNLPWNVDRYDEDGEGHYPEADNSNTNP